MQPRFQWSFLLPRYWLNWLGIATLYLCTLLPYPVLRHFGKGLGYAAKPFIKRRIVIAKRNLELCFTAMSDYERQQLLKKNIESVGMGVIETGMAWFWPDKRIKKWSTIEGEIHLHQAIEQHSGILLIGLHFLTLELGARIIGLYHQGIGVYRPHDNKLLDWVQYRGRLRSNKALIDRTNTKLMIRKLKQDEMLWYSPDHDYGPKNSVFASFFAVPQAATTVGTSLLMRTASPTILPFTPIRNQDGSGYTLSISPIAEGFPTNDTTEAAEFINRLLEKEILKAPECYMWLHRRFKTRPIGMPSLYENI